MERIDLKTGFTCNNNCIFCVQAHKKKFGNKTTHELKKYIKDSAKMYHGVVFTGGEATIRKDIFELVSFAKKSGYSLIQIQTNGRRFAYKEFCIKMIEAGANEFAVAIHGHKPVLHDYLTASKGSFEQTLQGIKNLISLHQKVLTNTVITKSNFRHLPEISWLLTQTRVPYIQFAFVHMLGNAFKYRYSVVPRKSLIAPYVKKAIDIGSSAGAKMTTEAIPFCFMSGYERYIAETNIPRTKVFDLDYTIEDFTVVRQNEAKTKGPLCVTCRHDKICEGPWKEYTEMFEWEEFKPVAKNKNL
jgi:molybdenum cofactor biosynthesis enzyme MoaA